MGEQDIALGSEWVGKLSRTRFKVVGVGGHVTMALAVHVPGRSDFYLSPDELREDYTPVERPFQVGDIVKEKNGYVSEVVTANPGNEWLGVKGGPGNTYDRRASECTLHISVDDLPDNSGRKTEPPRVDVVTPTVASIMAMPQVGHMGVDTTDVGEIEYTAYIAGGYISGGEQVFLSDTCLHSLVRQLEALKDSREYEIHYEVWEGGKASGRYDTFEEADEVLLSGEHIRAFKAYV